MNTVQFRLHSVARRATSESCGTEISKVDPGRFAFSLPEEPLCGGQGSGHVMGEIEDAYHLMLSADPGVD